MQENQEVSETDRRMIEIVNQHTQRINHIIEDILNISRDKPTLPEHIDLQSWIPDFIDRFCQSGEADKDCFDLQISTQQTDIVFDQGHLDRIMTNLCHNAIAHGEGGKPLTISVFDGAANVVCIEVADRGPGIEAELLDKIFEPFYTTGRKGSGLGLYIVSQLCELNNASIAVRQNQYNGSSFTVSVSNTPSMLKS